MEFDDRVSASFVLSIHVVLSEIQEGKDRLVSF